MMKTQELSRFTHSVIASARRPSNAAVAGLWTLGLAGLLAVSGCNRTPAPAAAPDNASAVPAAAPPAVGAPAAVSERPREERSRASAAATPPPPPPAPTVYTVPVGTRIVVRIQQTISAKNSNVGDSFSGTLAQAVVVNGVTVIGAGAPVTGSVTAARGQGRFKGSGDLGIAINRVGTYQVATASYETAAKGKGKRTAGFIGGGGGGGALIGGLAGGGKGALIGGLLGAGAGTAGAMFTGNKDITVPAESVVTFSLTDSFTATKQR